MIEAASGGDEAAIESLLHLCQTDVHRYARRNCSTLSDAEDAVQETLWLVYRKISTLRRIALFSGWLFTIVRRECLRLARKAFGTADAADFDEDVYFTRTTNDDLWIDLIAAIHSLPAHYREVLLLRDFEELTIGEIAVELKLTSPATKSRLHRARRLIQEYLLGK